MFYLRSQHVLMLTVTLVIVFLAINQLLLFSMPRMTNQYSPPDDPLHVGTQGESEGAALLSSSPSKKMTSDAHHHLPFSSLAPLLHMFPSVSFFQLLESGAAPKEAVFPWLADNVAVDFQETTTGEAAAAGGGWVMQGHFVDCLAVTSQLAPFRWLLSSPLPHRNCQCQENVPLPLPDDGIDHVPKFEASEEARQFRRIQMLVDCTSSPAVLGTRRKVSALAFLILPSDSDLISAASSPLMLGYVMSALALYLTKLLRSSLQMEVESGPVVVVPSQVISQFIQVGLDLDQFPVEFIAEGEVRHAFFRSLVTVPPEFLAWTLAEHAQWLWRDPALVASFKQLPMPGVSAPRAVQVIYLQPERDWKIHGGSHLLADLESSIGASVQVFQMQNGGGGGRNLTEALQRAKLVIGTSPALLQVLPLVNRKALVLELFPWQYQSLLVENLALAWDMSHASWQCQTAPPSASKLLYPVPWREGGAAIRAWRGQREIALHVQGVLTKIKAALRSHTTKSKPQRPSFGGRREFLLYAPWEQANNQLIGFRCACAIADLLGRTLVLPFFGERRMGGKEWNYSFTVGDFSWKPFEFYFNGTLLESLPCRTVSFSRFQLLTERGLLWPLRLWFAIPWQAMGETSEQASAPPFPATKKATVPTATAPLITQKEHRPLREVQYNPLFRHTTQQQLRDYYEGILGLRVQQYQKIKRHYQSNDYDILRIYGEAKDEVLALGATFWVYDFGSKFEYPYTEYRDLVSSHLTYRGISQQLRYRWDILELGARLAKMVHPDLDFVSLHYRRGKDYEVKCGDIEDLLLRERCFPSMSSILRKLEGLGAATTTVFVITNEAASAREELRWLRSRFSLFFFPDLWDSQERSSICLSDLELAQVEQVVGVMAKEFVGNLYSSFSRTIIEMRQAEGKPFDTF